MGSNQYCAGRIYDLCVLLYNGSTQSLTGSSFMEKSGIEPATSDLQGIGLSPTPCPVTILASGWQSVKHGKEF